MTLFESKLSYLKETDKGVKRVTETDIIEAFTFTECEAALIEQCDFKQLKDASIKSMKPITVNEIFSDETGNSEYWYRAKVLFVDPETGKGSKQLMFVQANTMDDAIRKLKDNMKDTIVDWESIEMKKTDIYEIILK